MSITQALMTPLLAGGAPRPLITHYDEAAGGRVELSRATVGNWAAKTANWLVDEFDVEPGTPVTVLLPAHWQTAGILLGAWWCGAHVVDKAEGAEVAFVPGSDSALGAGAANTVAVGLDALGGSVRGLPDAVLDYASEVRAQGDEFTPLAPVSGSSPALAEFTVDGLLEATRTRAAELGITEGSRVLSTLEWKLPGGIVDGLLTVLSARGSLVQCTGSHGVLLDRTTLDKRAADERTTVELGTGA